MSDNLNLGSEHCSRLVRERDEDRWLAAQYAPPPERRRLIALYAFQCELRRIPGAVSEPPLGEIRLQWWREALQDIRDGKSARGNPVVEEIAVCGIANTEYESLIDKVIDAAARPFYGEEFSTIDDLADWLEQADGTIDELAVIIIGGDTSLAETARQAGVAFSLAREGAGLAPNLKDEIHPKARSIWNEIKPGLKNIDAKITPAIIHLALTPAYLQKSNASFPIYKRVKMFATMALGWF